MNRALLLPVVLVAISASHAQPAFDKSICDIGLLTVESVKKEIGLTTAQRAAMNKHAAPFNEMGKKMQDKLAKGQKPTEAEQRKISDLREQLRNKVLGELTPAQLKRLREITLQEAGLMALASDEIVAKLGMSKDQAGKVRSSIRSGMERSAKIMTEAQKRLENEFKSKKPKTKAEEEKLSKQFQARLDEEMRKAKPQVERIAKETETKTMALLSAQQRSTWTALKGKAFKMT